MTTCMNMSTTREMLFYAGKPLYTYFSRQLLMTFFFTFCFLSLLSATLRFPRFSLRCSLSV